MRIQHRFFALLVAVIISGCGNDVDENGRCDCDCLDQRCARVVGFIYDDDRMCAGEDVVVGCFQQDENVTTDTQCYRSIDGDVVVRGTTSSPPYFHLLKNGFEKCGDRGPRNLFQFEGIPACP